jgi:hypothetical protein
MKMLHDTGVSTSFSRHSPDWHVVKNFHLLKQKTTWGQRRKISEREIKTPSPGWRVGFCFYPPSLIFTLIWWVGELVIWLSAPLHQWLKRQELLFSLVKQVLEGNSLQCKVLRVQVMCIYTLSCHADIFHQWLYGWFCLLQPLQCAAWE